MMSLKEMENWMNDENSGPVTCSVTGQSFKNRKEMTKWRRKVSRSLMQNRISIERRNQERNK